MVLELRGCRDCFDERVVQLSGIQAEEQPGLWHLRTYYFRSLEKDVDSLREAGSAVKQIHELVTQAVQEPELFGLGERTRPEIIVYSTVDGTAPSGVDADRP